MLLIYKVAKKNRPVYREYLAQPLAEAPAAETPVASFRV